MDKKKKNSRAARRCFASVTSLVEFRAKLQGASSDPLKLVGGNLRDGIGPLSDRSPAYSERTGNITGLLKMPDDLGFTHDTMLTIVPFIKQPCLIDIPLTLVDMKDWRKCSDLGERLDWALGNAGVSMVELADELKLTRAAISKWKKTATKNLKGENLFGAAKFLKVNAEWLATGKETPFTSIPSFYKEISGPYLKMARDLTELDDNDLKKTVSRLIDSYRKTIEKPNFKKDPTTVVEDQRR